MEPSRKRALGRVAHSSGVAVAIAGLLSALMAAGFYRWIFPEGIVGVAVGVGLAMMTAIVSALLFWGGVRLERQGLAEREDAAERLLRHRLERNEGDRRAITSVDAASLLDMPVDEAESLLTDIAKRFPGRWRVEINGDGRLEFSLEGAPSVRARVASVSQGGPASPAQASPKGEAGEEHESFTADDHGARGGAVSKARPTAGE